MWTFTFPSNRFPPLSPFHSQLLFVDRLRRFLNYGNTTCFVLPRACDPASQFSQGRLGRVSCAPRARMEVNNELFKSNVDNTWQSPTVFMTWWGLNSPIFDSRSLTWILKSDVEKREEEEGVKARGEDSHLKTKGVLVGKKWDQFWQGLSFFWPLKHSKRYHFQLALWWF